MREKVRWTHVTIALAVIAALAIAAPALGGPSLKKLVKKEVAKQIAKATGPAGPAGPAGSPGANGTNGADGTDGTARAYARVTSHALLSCVLGPFADECSVSHTKGVAAVIHPSVGNYCVEAPGISSASVPAAVTVDWQGTSSPEGNASAMTRDAVNCPTGWFQVITERHGATTDAAEADNVGFTIVIP
jgi:hypothetical protein